MVEVKVIKPQPGPQTQFLSSSADIVIFGGGASGGKTWGILAEPLRHISNKGFGGVTFRRTTKQIDNEGGLWDESLNMYTNAGGAPRSHKHDWQFPSGSTLAFAHLEHEKNIYDWQGSQIAFIGFDELCHFTEKQFWYMLSRNRSMCGIRPYVRATCNPDADSWVATFIDWWIGEEGYPIQERSGVLRWFVRIGDSIKWADEPEGLAHYTDDKGSPIPPKSVTFIPSLITDNQKLMDADPSYMANLMALSTVERERLLHGNWKIRPAAGMYFQRSWCETVDAIPAGARFVRGWDLASTPKTEANDPDFTCGTKIGKLPDGRYIIADHVRDRLAPSGVERLLMNTASKDGRTCNISIPQDPGAAGKSYSRTLISMLNGYNTRATPETGDKITRFNAFSAQAEAGSVLILRGSWNDEWANELESFGPDAKHDDDADSTSRAFNALNGGRTQAVFGSYG